MNTSIGLSKATKLKLKRLKKLPAETFEEVVLRLIKLVPSNNKDESVFSQIMNNWWYTLSKKEKKVVYEKEDESRNIPEQD